MAEPKIKYDRQLRGRQILRNQAYLLNCGPTGSETLKILVLGGVGSITVIDGSKVELGDLGNSFMVDELCVGKSKAKTVCAFLQELNDAVKSKFIEEYPEALIDSNPSSFFSQFTLVIATQRPGFLSVSVLSPFEKKVGPPTLQTYTQCELLVEDSMMKLDRICPLQKALSWVQSILFFTNTRHMLSFLLRWLKSGPKLMMETCHRPEKRKKKFKDLIKSKMIATDDDNYNEAVEASFKVFAPQGISLSVRQIVNDSCADVNSNSSDFWVLVAALKDFIANEGGGEAPLEGSIPDMTSSTELYINLQRIYQAKAEEDFLVMEQHVRKILKKIGRDTDSISKATIKSFCKNARKSKVCRYRPIEDEFNSPVQVELQKYLTDEDYSIAVGFYFLLRVVDCFAANNNSFPGQYDGEMDEEISRLKTTAVALVSDLGCNGSTLTEDLINEMCRYGAAELHAVAAFIGGIASQEVIKLITSQFVPMSGTFIFNGIDHKSQLLLL